MAYCPKCKAEYRPGFTVCSDCHISLVEELPKEESKGEGFCSNPFVNEKAEGMRPVKLITTSNKIEAGMVQGLLANNNIQSMVISPSAGSIMNIRDGFSYFGEEIYVDERDIETAREVLKVMEVQEE